MQMPPSGFLVCGYTQAFLGMLGNNFDYAYISLGGCARQNIRLAVGSAKWIIGILVVFRLSTCNPYALQHWINYGGRAIPGAIPGGLRWALFPCSKLWVSFNRYVPGMGGTGLGTMEMYIAGDELVLLKRYSCNSGA